MEISTLTRRGLIAAAVAGALALAGCGDKGAAPAANTAAKADLTPIGIVQLVEHSALDAATRGIVDALAERGYKDGVNIKLDIQNAQGDQSNLHNIANRFVSNKDKVIFAVATPAAQAVATVAKDTPIVATAITDFVAAKLVKSDAAPGGNVTGVSNLGPIADQLALLVELTGEKTRTQPVGVIFNPSEVNAEYQVEKFRAEAKARGITVVEAAAGSVNDVPQAIASMKGKVCALWLPTDNVLASAAANVAKLAIDARLPVIASDSALVRSGSLASISVDYYELGRMTGAIGADILEGKKKPADTPIAFQSARKPLLNLKTAQAIGLAIPEKVLAESDKIE